VDYGQQLTATLILTVVGFALAANVWNVNDRYVAVQRRIWHWSDSTSQFFVKSYRVASGVFGAVAFGFFVVTLVEWALH
jgi:hypothetical protein